MRNPSSTTIPVLLYGCLTRLYDPFMRWTMHDTRIKQQLIELAQIGEHDQVLDVGCGTGTLLMLLYAQYPQAHLVGLDADATVLTLAHEKFSRLGSDVTLVHGKSSALPFPEGTFDRVVSSLVFHHLVRDEKIRAAQEIYRVLRPGEFFNLLDFGKPRTMGMRLITQVMRHFEETPDNYDGLLPVFLQQAGFQTVDECLQTSTLFGPLAYYAAQKPAMMPV